MIKRLIVMIVLMVILISTVCMGEHQYDIENAFDAKKINLTSDRTVTIMRLPTGHFAFCMGVMGFIEAK